MLRSNIMKWFLVTVCLTTALAAYGVLVSPLQGADDADAEPAGSLVVPESPVALSEFLSRAEEGRHALSVDNSQVVVRTPRIDAAVQVGPKLIPALLDILKTEDISFDLFLRCYSVCDQIIRKQNPQEVIWWSGGAEPVRSRQGTIRLVPGGQIDQKKFRKKVCDDIRRAMNDMRSK